MLRHAGFAGFALMAALLAAPEARAQAVELTAFGGLAFGGELIATPGLESVSLQAGPLYGGAFNVEFLPRWRFEGLVMRQESKVRGPASGTCVDVNVDRYMLGVQEQERLSERFDIFGEFMLGATRYAPAGYESELWFTLGASAGVKTYVTQEHRVPLRSPRILHAGRHQRGRHVRRIRLRHRLHRDGHVLGRHHGRRDHRFLRRAPPAGQTR